VIAGTISGLSIPHFCEWYHGQQNCSPLYKGKHDLWYERRAAHGPMLEQKVQGGSSLQTSESMQRDAITGHTKSKILSGNFNKWKGLPDRDSTGLQ